MNWWSEAALIWLPRGERPYPADFAQRAAPGTNDFFYYALDAFACVSKRAVDVREEDRGEEPWVYVVEDRLLLSPAEIDALMPQWETARGQVSATRAAG